MLDRHCRGDWGDDLNEQDQLANNEALTTGARLLSSYVIKGLKIWVITEAEDAEGFRIATTVLLPEDY